MNERSIFSQKLIKLEHQPDFPRADLNTNNADMLKYVLGSEEGVVAHGEHLKPFHSYIHSIADRALKMSGVKTRYSEDELVAFSQGFASFEAINLLVRPPRLFNMQAAQKRVQHLLLSPEFDPFELEAAELLGTADDYASRIAHFSPEIELSERQHKWQQDLPNTHDVIVEIGERRHETMEQLHARTAGAHIAYQLVAKDLDEV